MANGADGGFAVPPPGSRFHGALLRYGEPERKYEYKLPGGETYAWICRYTPKENDPPGDHDGLLTRYFVRNKANLDWRISQGIPSGLQPYNADLLNAHPDWPVYVVDSEESADALAALIGPHTEAVVTTWVGGLSKLRDTYWDLLRRRPVTLWPRKNISSLHAFTKLGVIAASQECAVTVVDLRWDEDIANDTSAYDLCRLNDWEKIQALLVRCVRLFGADASPPERIPIGPTTLDPDTGLPPGEKPLELPAGEAPPPEWLGRGERAVSDAPLPTKWRKWGLDLDPRGLPYQNVCNVNRFLESQQGAYGDAWFDEFHCKVLHQPPGASEPREWGEEDTIELQIRLQSLSGAGLHKIGRNSVHEAVMRWAKAHPRHEYREWLLSLQWDGVERLKSVLVQGWGTADDEYFQTGGRVFLMQSVARVLKPGCQADLMFVFEGSTGIGKTMALQHLFGERYVDNPTTHFGNKDFYQGLLGKVCIEVADFAATQGVSLEQIYSDITRKHDRFRPPYGRVPVDYPRQCIFVGTTEKDDWNRDERGTARRFIPVRCGRLDHDWIRDHREQLFAEAVARVERGESWWDMPVDRTRAEQMARAAPDVYEEKIAIYLKALNGRQVSTACVIQEALQIPDTSKWDLKLQQRVCSILRRFGWIQVVTTLGKKTVRVWRDRSPEILGNGTDGPHPPKTQLPFGDDPPPDF